MKRKVLIISSIVLAVLIIISLFLILNKNNKKEETTDIVSTIILDINPRIKLNLDKEDTVFDAIALNEEATEIVEYLNGKDIKTAIETINSRLIEKEFIKDDTIILLNVEGEVSSSDVLNLINEDLKTKNKEIQIIETKATESSKQISDEYNISVSKAAYIESIIEKNPELKIEDLKDKSITEITNLKENKKEETTQTTTAITNPTVKTTKKTTVKTTVSIPSNPTDTSGVWCTYNKNKPAASKFDYPADIGLNKAREYALLAINSSSLGLKGNTLSRVDDKRSSYCLSYKFMGYNDDNKYYVTIDSVTGSVIEKSVVPMDKPKITEEEAKTIGINRFGIDPNACDFVQAYLDMNNGKLRYTFAARCSGTQYDLEIDAITGAVSKERTWT